MRSKAPAAATSVLNLPIVRVRLCQILAYHFPLIISTPVYCDGIRLEVVPGPVLRELELVLKLELELVLKVVLELAYSGGGRLVLGLILELP
jgi:hypothetical protein